MSRSAKALNPTSNSDSVSVSDSDSSFSPSSRASTDDDATDRDNLPSASKPAPRKRKAIVLEPAISDASAAHRPQKQRQKPILPLGDPSLQSLMTIHTYPRHKFSKTQGLAIWYFPQRNTLPFDVLSPLAHRYMNDTVARSVDLYRSRSLPESDQIFDFNRPIGLWPLRNPPVSDLTPRSSFVVDEVSIADASEQTLDPLDESGNGPSPILPLEDPSETRLRLDLLPFALEAQRMAKVPDGSRHLDPKLARAVAESTSQAFDVILEGLRAVRTYATQSQMQRRIIDFSLIKYGDWRSVIAAARFAGVSDRAIECASRRLEQLFPATKRKHVSSSRPNYQHAPVIPDTFDCNSLGAIRRHNIEEYQAPLEFRYDDHFDASDEPILDRAALPTETLDDLSASKGAQATQALLKRLRRINKLNI